MTFSYKTKKELCKFEDLDLNQLKAEAYGFLLFIKKFSCDEIIMSTENPFVADRFSYLLSSIWQVITEKKTTLTGKKNSSHLFTVTVPLKSDCNIIFKDLGHSEKDISLRVNRANFYCDESMSYFLRGVFLSCGNISDPEKEYHLEFSISYKNLCDDLCKIIFEVDVLNFLMKTLIRKGNYMAYVKDSEKISDFLAYIEAPIASMDIIGAKVIKNMRNNLNRKVNFEVANMDKTLSASLDQITAINIIKDKIGISGLPDELQELAVLRLEKVDYSLKKLGEKLTPPISKSGVNHRMKKILEIAKELK